MLENNSKYIYIYGFLTGFLNSICIYTFLFIFSLYILLMDEILTHRLCMFMPITTGAILRP